MKSVENEPLSAVEPGAACELCEAVEDGEDSEARNCACDCGCVGCGELGVLRCCGGRAIWCGEVEEYECCPGTGFDRCELLV